MKKSDKRIRIQVFSGSSSHYKQFELSLNKLAMLCIAAILGLTLLVTGGIFVVNKIKSQVDFGSWVIENLGLDNEVYAAEIQHPLKDDAPGVSLGMGHAFSKDNDSLFAEAYTQNALIVSDDTDVAEKTPGFAEGTSEISEAIGDLEKQFHAVIDLQEKLDLNPSSLKHMPSIPPLLQGRISDLFGKRKDPFKQTLRHHHGLDIAAPRGTEIHAPAAGIVEVAQVHYVKNRGYGRQIRIRHGDQIQTIFGHLYRIHVKPGQKVNRWDVIGTVGSTGRSTGPHLHYEVWKDGQAIDPMEFIVK